MPCPESSLQSTFQRSFIDFSLLAKRPY
jgi:hypothetical protein